MAKMIPDNGPAFTNSRAERELYNGFKNLDDNFVIIHSFPWLNSAISTIDPRKVLLGETDFIILHPDLGILAIEVKGGKFTTKNGRFVFTKSGSVFDPFQQLQKGAITLSKYVQEAGLNVRVGQAFIFPDSELKNPPALYVDIATKTKIYIDAKDYGQITTRIIEIMKFWRTNLPPAKLSFQNIDKLVELIAPTGDNQITWEVIINQDKRRWLTLTSEQEMILTRAIDNQRVVIRGRPGTGKTLIALDIAKRKSSEGKKVLFISYNRLLIEEKLTIELQDHRHNTDVMTFHKLCYQTSKEHGRRLPENDNDQIWFDEIGPDNLKKALNMSQLAHYDVLIVDEAQVLHLDWLETLKNWIPTIYVFCDPSQSFNYEANTKPNEIEDLIDAEYSGILTAAIRTLKEVHNRLEIAIPDKIQQVSLREYEEGRVEEYVTISSTNELAKVINKLHNEGVSAEHIAVIHDSNLELSDDLRQKIHGCYSSGKVRGLEYPIVICVDIYPDDETKLIVAYTRATSKIITIYSTTLLNRLNNLEQYPFFQQIMKKPEVIAVLKDKENLMMHALGWHWLPTHLPYSMKWVKSIGMWLVDEIESNRDSENRLEYIKQKNFVEYVSILTKKPVVFISTDIVLSITILNSNWERYFIKSCSRCQNMALTKILFDKDNNQLIEICVHCGDVVPEPIPDLSKLEKEIKVWKNPQQATDQEKLSLPSHMMALGILDSLIFKHPEHKNYICDLCDGGDFQKNFYRLIIAQILFKKGIGNQITKQTMIENIPSWVKEDDRKKLKDYIGQTLQLLVNRGWLKKLEEKGHFVIRLNSHE